MDRRREKRISALVPLWNSAADGSFNRRYRLTRLRTLVHRILGLLPPAWRETVAERLLRRRERRDQQPNTSCSTSSVPKNPFVASENEGKPRSPRAQITFTSGNIGNASIPLWAPLP